LEETLLTFSRSHRRLGVLAAMIALVLSPLHTLETSAQFEVSDAIDYGGGRYGVFASQFGNSADGLVGNMTSSGYVLKENDRLVALPACTASSCPWLDLGTDKSDPFGAQTSCAEADGLCWVQIYAPETDSCAVAPVLDRGPLFVMDNWWAADRDRVYELPKGQPAAEIVRSGGTVGFGNGYSDRGYNVQRDFSYGPAIDLAAGTWADIGLSPQRMAANVEVTLLWQAGITHQEACAGAASSPSNAATTDDVNFRSGPSTSDAVLDVLTADTRVLVTGGASNGFYPVDFDGTSGWVFGDYLALDEGAATGRMATTTDEVNFRAGPSTSDDILSVLLAGSLVTLTGQTSGDFLSVSFRGQDGWVSSQYLDAGGDTGQQPSSGSGTATVLEALNLRAGPSTGDEILDIMPAGTTVELTGESEAGFVSVQFGGQSGWAYAVYLEAAGQPIADESATVREDLNLRAGPSTSDEILDVMPAGASVTLTGNGDNRFVSVIYQSVEGWAHGDYLE
jgi:uncharacterized protein YraI